ncbi:CUB and EGF-like domain-containing protein 2, partial [Durusdinium trenchii]
MSLSHFNTKTSRKDAVEHGFYGFIAGWANLDLLDQNGVTTESLSGFDCAHRIATVTVKETESTDGYDPVRSEDRDEKGIMEPEIQGAADVQVPSFAAHTTSEIASKGPLLAKDVITMIRENYGELDVLDEPDEAAAGANLESWLDLAEENELDEEEAQCSTEEGSPGEPNAGKEDDDQSRCVQPLKLGSGPADTCSVDPAAIDVEAGAVRFSAAERENLQTKLQPPTQRKRKTKKRMIEMERDLELAFGNQHVSTHFKRYSCRLRNKAKPRRNVREDEARLAVYLHDLQQLAALLKPVAKKDFKVACNSYCCTWGNHKVNQRRLVFASVLDQLQDSCKGAHETDCCGPQGLSEKDLRSIFTATKVVCDVATNYDRGRIASPKVPENLRSDLNAGLEALDRVVPGMQAYLAKHGIPERELKPGRQLISRPLSSFCTEERTCCDATATMYSFTNQSISYTALAVTWPSSWCPDASIPHEPSCDMHTLIGEHNLSKKDLQFITSLMEQGVDDAGILLQLQTKHKDQVARGQLKKIMLIDRTALANIRSQNKLGWKLGGTDEEDLELRIGQDPERKVYRAYKPFKVKWDSERCFGLDLLNLRPADDEFIAVAADECMLSKLRLYGGYLLMADSTHNVSNKEGVKLVTIMVQDEQRRGQPVLWAVTNFEDERLYTALFHAIRKLHGGADFHCPVVLSDMDPSIWAGFRNVFEPRRCAGMTRPLWCTWHVLKALKNAVTTRVKQPKQLGKNAKKHATSRLKTSLFSLLYYMVYARTRECFDGLWRTAQELMEIHGAKDLHVFLKNQYLRNEFVIRKWALHARLDVQTASRSETIKNNMNLESFHQKLKQNLFLGRANKWISKLMLVLEQKMTAMAVQAAKEAVDGKATLRNTEVVAFGSLKKRPGLQAPAWYTEREPEGQPQQPSVERPPNQDATAIAELASLMRSTASLLEGPRGDDDALLAAFCRKIAPAVADLKQVAQSALNCTGQPATEHTRMPTRQRFARQYMRTKGVGPVPLRALPAGASEAHASRDDTPQEQPRPARSASEVRNGSLASAGSSEGQHTDAGFAASRVRHRPCQNLAMPARRTKRARRAIEHQQQIRRMKSGQSHKVFVMRGSHDPESMSVEQYSALVEGNLTDQDEIASENPVARSGAGFQALE